MKTIISHRLTHFVLLVISLGLIAYYFFGDIKRGEAVTNIVIGTLEVKLAPSGGDAGTESVMIGYSGLGLKNITGWTIENGDTEVYTFDNIILQSNDSVKVCAQASKEQDCDNEWNGGDVWDDGGGTLNLFDNAGNRIISVSYTDGSPGTIARNTVEFTEAVYEKNDGVKICHSAQGETKYSSPKAQVSSIVDRQKGHVTHTADIIPPFFYSLGTSIGYFEGKNWPAKQAFYNNGCT